MKYHIIPVTSFNQNCSLVWCERTNEGVLIDPGGESKRLRSEIDRLEVRINKILLTHGHIDHIGGAMDLKQYYSVPIFGPHQSDRLFLDNVSFQCRMLGMDEVFSSNVIPDFWLKDGDIINVGCEIFNVLHCPGHSPGHVIFLNKKQKFIIMGDVLFKDGIGRTDLPGGNFQILVNSIRTKLVPLEYSIFFIPGHGPSSTLGYTLYSINNLL